VIDAPPKPEEFPTFAAYLDALVSYRVAEAVEVLDGKRRERERKPPRRTQRE
jgi:hypothetical protein